MRPSFLDTVVLRAAVASLAGLVALGSCTKKTARMGEGTGGAGGVGGDAGAPADAGGGGGAGGIGGVGGPVGAGGAPDAGTGGAGGASGAGGGAAATYDEAVLADHPVGYWAMSRPSGTEPDLSGNGNPGSYRGGAPALVALPNGDQAASFNGSSQYLTIPSRAAYSIPTTGNLTWEAWIRPAVLQFPNDSNGYVDWMGKCAEYAPSCEWEARMYNTTNPQNRCNRLSAYVFNPGAGLGSGADWQPVCGLLQAGEWLHVVGEYTTRSQPAACPNPSMYPGAINIWVDGVPWNQAAHNPTGCMGQYSIVPRAGDSPINVGTMATDAWFQGAIGKLAIYDYLLTSAQITAHFRTMTGRQPNGTCANTCTRTN